MKTDPAAALQHTRCIQALTAIGICTDSSVIDVSGLGALEKQIAKVKRWRDAAAVWDCLKTLTTLCNALEKVDPQIAEIGTRVYERAA